MVLGGVFSVMGCTISTPERKPKKLQAYADSLITPFKFSVVAGPSGSYREQDLLTMQDKWLKPWGPGRQWELWGGDAYAPGLTDNIQRQCWQKGYVSVTHGGGASMVAQVNDTDFHKPWRKSFVDKQQVLVLEKTMLHGGGLHSCTDEENIALISSISQALPSSSSSSSPWSSSS